MNSHLRYCLNMKPTFGPRDLTAAGKWLCSCILESSEAGIPAVYKIYRNDVLLTTITEPDIQIQRLQ